MCEIFATFAATGDPNNELIAPIQWQPFVHGTTKNDQNGGLYKVLNVSNAIYFIDWPDLERMRFWDKIYEKIEEIKTMPQYYQQSQFSQEPKFSKQVWIEIEQKNIDGE